MTYACHEGRAVNNHGEFTGTTLKLVHVVLRTVPDVGTKYCVQGTRQIYAD